MNDRHNEAPDPSAMDETAWHPGGLRWLARRTFRPTAWAQKLPRHWLGGRRGLRSGPGPIDAGVIPGVGLVERSFVDGIERPKPSLDPPTGGLVAGVW